MTDVSRALLLPQLAPPTERALGSLALYWDELVVPRYVERYFVGGTRDAAETDVLVRLRDEGVVIASDREVDLNDLVPLQLRDDLGPNVVTLAATPDVVDELRKKHPGGGDTMPVIVGGQVEGIALQISRDDARQVLASHVTNHLLQRMDDATSLAEREHLAPVACSRVSHLASVLGTSSPELPRKEAALLTVAVSAVQLRPETTVDDLLQFREKSRATRAKFRAAMGDLATELQGDTDPTRLLSQARDRYRNQVVPRLAELEGILKENRIMFVWRSVTRTTAVAMAPVRPVAATESGAQLVAESLNYSFSKEKLIQDHPYGFLHELSTDLGVEHREPFPELLAEHADGAASLRRVIIQEGIPTAVEHFLGQVPGSGAG